MDVTCAVVNCLRNASLLRSASARSDFLSFTSSNSPRFVVNRNNGDDPGDPKPARVATNTVYFDKDRPSALVLPVIYLNDGR